MNLQRPPRIPQNNRIFPRQFQWANYRPRPSSAPFQGNASPRTNNLNFCRQQTPRSLNEEYWCETCDRGFSTKDQLDKHNLQHQKCNIDGCQFVAHPKVITKHIQMQHSTGLFKKIGKLNNPDEIKKWIEERKKKYPTKVNVEIKAAQAKEKIERGEKMGLKHDKNNRFNQSSDTTYKRKLPFNKNDNHEKQKRFKQTFTKKSNPQKFPKKTQDFPAREVCRKLHPFAGIQDLLKDSDTEDCNTEQDKLDFFIEDDDESTSCIKKPAELHNNGTEPIICGALSSLIGDYGSSDEELNTTKQNIEVLVRQNNEKTLKFRENDNKNNDNSKQNYIDKTVNESDNDSGPEEVNVIKKGEIEDNTANCNVTKNSKSNRREISKLSKSPSVYKKYYKPKIPSTLLQKLLHREILHERNIVLQCIRHIVKHDYFDKK